MTQDDFNAYCASLKAATHVVQWGGSDVWKVGGKVFALGAWHAGKNAGITFKVSEFAYDVLRDMPGLRPAPYLASRGMTWIQQYAEPGLDGQGLRRPDRGVPPSGRRGADEEAAAGIGIVGRRRGDQRRLICICGVAR